MRRYFLTATVMVLVTLAGVTAAVALANGDHGKPEFVTFCHAAGLEGTTKFVTLTLPYNAVFGQAGHFNENGTTAAGHEQDYLGPCNGEPNPCLEGAASTQYDEECPPPPTETEPTTTTPTTTTPTTTTPTTPTPPRCPPGTEPTGGKDGDESEPHHNQECKPITPTTTTTPTTSTTTTPTTTTPTTTAPTPTTPTTTTPTTPTTTTPSGGTPPKTPKPAANPKPRVTVKPKPPKPKGPHVCLPLADGTKRAWYKGGNGMKPGCYPIIEGSG